MSIALRVDSITPMTGGRTVVGFTYGTTPLSAEAAGDGVETSVATLNSALAEIEPRNLMILLLFAAWKSANPALNNPSLVIGKTITVNPGNASTPVTIA